MRTAIKTIAANAIDDVRGVIIGDVIAGALFYDGRQQGPNIYGYSDDEIIEKGRALRAELTVKLSGHPCYLYQNPELWEVRIYDRF